jgi:hypothetical protein
LIHTGELLNVDANLASGVLAEFSEQHLSAAESSHHIKNNYSLTRRETSERHIALAPAVIPVVIAAEAHYR